ncbi:hypothetical protein HLH12_04625 [Acinetobacter sp. NIPH 2377]|uniref:AbiH family protein n=1 Tax=Acinetobacter terrestris TaxID=2529843 RepID=UPI0014907E08|nr:AbiH family protein [Acinetobacter terrestris]NNH34860.1 hypothetical protein [Acinetobacter terrestris]
MNILIVGNGFDLSHYLPTKYDHFMLVMKAIEKKDLEKPINDVLYSPFEDPIHLFTKYFQIARAIDKKTYQMNFDDLFSELRKPQDINFIENTKRNYETSKINLAEEQIRQIQKKLNKNNWYQYFKHHVKEIKTWIDFEQKIEEVLVVLGKVITRIEQNEVDFNNLEINMYDFLDKNSVMILNHFLLFKEVGGYQKVKQDYISTPVQLYLNSIFCHGGVVTNGFSPSLFLEFLSQQLDDFIEIFNLYLELVIDKLQLETSLEIFVKSDSLFELNKNCWIKPDLIYSFNYTNTYQRIYGLVEVEYLHGSHGENQNIVLGISDLEHDSLRKLKAYGFTKYHQKLFKDTDYLFLDEYKIKTEKIKKEISDLQSKILVQLQSAHLNSLQCQLDDKYKNQSLDLNISIWGHSLDLSDKDYIIDLFSLNDDMDRNVRVTVYYFDQNAKFTLLNNLLAILEKDKVEEWMKNKWLQFKPNPKIKFDEMISEKTA